MKVLAPTLVLLSATCCTMPEPERTTIALRTIDLPKGITLEYAEQGDPSQMPVILLPGYTDPWQAYAPVLEHLPSSVHAIALSQRGQGRSSKPASGYRPEDYANDLLSFMDTLDIDRAVLVGHSMSSYAAQRFAIDHPDRTLGLVLIGSFTTLRGDPVITTFKDSIVSKLTDPVDASFVRDFTGSTFSKPVPQAFLDTIVALGQQVPAHVWKMAITDLSEADHSDRLGAITAPVLLVWGERDPLIPRSQQDALLAAIPGSRLLVYEGDGHSPNWEEPQRFAKDLIDLVQGLR